jgi:UDP-N-acetylglucosamine 2-epimerase (non-hydrolysing)
VKVLSSASARPNFVKLAAVHHALAKTKGVEHVIVHTGQHYDPLLSDVFFTQLQIPDPVYNLGIKGGGDREAIISATAQAFEPVLKKEKPDIVLAYGDVNGAIGAARAAKKLGIRIGHVEAGLRSFDPAMPEELNRIEIDSIADELFITEKSAELHLKKEGVKGHIHFVGNTMIDTLVRMRSSVDALPLAFDPPEKFGIVTVHRPSNVDNPATLKNVLEFLGQISAVCPLVFPLHLRTKASVEKYGMQSLLSSLRVVEPLGYLQFLRLASESQFILTDSGGIQEEATFLGKRCFTMRRNTERPSTIDSGSNVLSDPPKEADRKTVLDFARDPAGVQVTVPPLWAG